MKYSYKKQMKKLLMLFLFLPAVLAAVAQVPGTPYGVTAFPCAAAPATPGTITLSATTVNLNGTFTASITAVSGATSYVWTLPTGLTGTSTTNSITITGATAGTYAVGTIKVAAKNDCGTSATSNSASAVTVRSCAAAPATPGAITLSATTVYLNGTFTASIADVSGATSYQWTLPAGLSGSSSGTTISISALTVGTYAAGTIKVVAVNACGLSTARNSGSTISVNSAPVWSSPCAPESKNSCTCPSGKSRVAYDAASDAQRDAATQLTQNRWYRNFTSGNPDMAIWNSIFYPNQWLLNHNIKENWFVCF
jgi:hypothetical protein